MYSCHQPCSNRLNIPLDPTNLPRKQDLGMHFHLEGFTQQRRSIDIRVAVDLTIPQETRILEPRNQTKDTRLFTKFQVILETHEVVGVRAQVFLPQLHDRIGSLASPRIS